jgi:peptide/nickel transport system substrate-binding protein
VDGRLRDPVRPQHHRSAQDLSFGRNRLVAAAAILAAAVTAAGCGGDSTEPVTPGNPPAPSGTLGIAIPDPPSTLDPLLATSAADRLVVGQIYEPLTRGVSAPYGQGTSEPGLALWARAGGGGTIWRVRLRPGVRFSDGARLDAAAVLENAMRWRTTGPGQALLPGLVAADAPRPDLVRFIFDRPVTDFRHRLASARLGVVSPRALRHANAGARLANGQAAGTGPFEVHRRTRSEILLARNTRWWGTRQDLGPAVELIAVRFPRSADRRLALLRRGTVQIAEGLGSTQAHALRRDPLLTGETGSAGMRTGLSRAVRGFPPGAGTPLLSRTWLTTVGRGEG